MVKAPPMDSERAVRLGCAEGREGAEELFRRDRGALDLHAVVVEDAPRPMSASFSITVAAMLVPPGLSFGQCPLVPPTMPGGTRSLI